MSDDPSNFSGSSVTPALTTTNAAPSTDLVRLPGLNLLEDDIDLVSNTSYVSVKTEISNQGDVNNNLILSQNSNIQETVVPVKSDTIMEATEESISKNQCKSEIDLQHHITDFLDNSSSKNVATKQEENDVIIKDAEIQEISTHETNPESVNAVLANETDKEPTEQLELKNEQIETVIGQIQAPTELEELNEPVKVVLEEKEEDFLKSSTHSTDSAAALPETNFVDIINENEKQQTIIVGQKDEQNTLQPIAVSTNNELDAIDRALNNDPIHYSSDDEIKQYDSEIGVTKNKTENGNNSDSSDFSISSSDSNSDSDSDNDENLRKRGNQELDEDDLSDDNDDNTEGPVKSAHEILDEPAPKIPDNLKITPQTQIEHVGEIFSVTGKTVVIKASVSGEFRVLEDHSVFCSSDRVPFGVLYETFGRVQAPFYSVKFESEEEAAPFKLRRGEKVFYVVSASKFLFTDKIKAIKGSDASNFHDEEVPEEEQEFSDDEKERMASSIKKSKKKKKKTKHDDADQTKNTESSIVASTAGNSNSVGSNRPSRNNRGKPARGRGGFQSYPHQPHNSNNIGQSTNYQNSHNNHVYGQSYNLPNSGGNFGQPINQQYNMGFNSGNPSMPYYNSQQQVFNQQQQYNPQQPYFNVQQQGQQQQQGQYQQQQQQLYNPLQQHQFQMMQQIMMNFNNNNNNPASNQMSPLPGLSQQQGSSSFSYQQQQPQGPPGRQGPPRSYDTDLNYGGGSN